MLPEDWQQEVVGGEFSTRKARIEGRTRSGSVDYGNALIALLATGAACTLLYWAADLVR